MQHSMYTDIPQNPERGGVKSVENTLSYLDPVEKTPSDYDSFTTIPDET